MLRIATLEEPDQGVSLRLQGRVSGPWVAELDGICQAARARDRAVTLDLADVSFVDREGIALFRRLLDWPVRLRNCSPFVAEQLREVATCRRARPQPGGPSDVS